MERWWSAHENENGFPAEWWGSFRVPKDRLSLIDLVRLGALDAATAAFLWVAMQQRATVIVTAREHGAGKTTLLSALIDFLPGEVRPYYVRGLYERFAFLESYRPEESYLLVNEISDHLPIYLWGAGVRRVFALLKDGWRLGATVHAAGAEEVIALLQRFPLEVPLEYLRAIDLVVTLGMGVSSEGFLRRVMRVETFRLLGEDLQPQLLARRETLRSSLVVYPAALLAFFEERFRIPLEKASRELARRQRQIARWVSQEIRGPRALHAALASLQLTESVDGGEKGSTIEKTLDSDDEIDQAVEVEETG